MQERGNEVIFLLDVFGTFVFALSGAFRAVKYELDLLGVVVLAVATGVGGGIMRDLMLGIMPPVAFRSEIYLVVCIGAGLAVFLAARRLAELWKYVMAADAIGLSVFAAIGAAKASEAGLGSVGIMFMAALTATGGGVIRDVLVCQIPAVLKTGFYASAAIIGGAVYVVTGVSGLPHWAQMTSCILVTYISRLVAMRTKASLPHVKKLPLSPSEMADAREHRHEKGPV